MVWEVIANFFEELIVFLNSTIESIPISISFGTAVIITMMAIASYVASPLIKALVIPVWIFAIITYFYPTIIPKEYEFMYLVVFGSMIIITLTILDIRGIKIIRLRKSHIDKALSDIMKWMNENNILNKDSELNEQQIRNQIAKIIRKYRLS